MISTRRPRFLYALLLLPLMMGAKNGKGCCGKDVEETEVVIETPVVLEKLIQVVSIDPSTVAPNTPFDAKIYGAEFVSGATARIGDIEANRTSVKDANTILAGFPGLPAGTYDVKVTNPDGKSATIRRGLTVKSAMGDCKFVRVGFDFDQSSVRSDAQATLNGKMSCYQAATGRITVEGHADERGTTEYNLALGERRAEAVKRYLTNGGISTSRISTVSYGEEKPVATGHDEGAWASNRRADISASE